MGHQEREGNRPGLALRRNPGAVPGKALPDEESSLFRLAQPRRLLLQGNLPQRQRENQPPLGSSDLSIPLLLKIRVDAGKRTGRPLQEAGKAVRNRRRRPRELKLLRPQGRRSSARNPILLLHKNRNDKDTLPNRLEEIHLCRREQRVLLRAVPPRGKKDRPPLPPGPRFKEAETLRRNGPKAKLPAKTAIFPVPSKHRQPLAGTMYRSVRFLAVAKLYPPLAKMVGHSVLWPLAPVVKPYQPPAGIPHRHSVRLPLVPGRLHQLPTGIAIHPKLWHPSQNLRKAPAERLRQSLLFQELHHKEVLMENLLLLHSHPQRKPRSLPPAERLTQREKRRKSRSTPAVLL